MTQEHFVPDQKELDAIVFQAKALRNKTIVALFTRLLQLPMILKQRAAPAMTGSRDLAHQQAHASSQ